MLIDFLIFIDAKKRNEPNKETIGWDSQVIKNQPFNTWTPVKILSRDYINCMDAKRQVMQTKNKHFDEIDTP